MDNELIDALLSPVSADCPCGGSIRDSPEFNALVVARQEDDDTLPCGVWQTTLFPTLLMELINDDDATRRVWRQLEVLP
jgi:hypothetical protein